MNTAQNGKGSRARKVDGERYRACKLWDKKAQEERESEEDDDGDRCPYYNMMQAKEKQCDWCGENHRH